MTSVVYAPPPSGTTVVVSGDDVIVDAEQTGSTVVTSTGPPGPTGAPGADNSGYSASTAPVTRPTTGAPIVLSTDIVGDFAIDSTAGIMYGPLTGTPVLGAAWINGVISGAVANYLSKAILGQKSYLPTGPSSYTTTSTTLVAIDSTNVTATFTAPPSGQVWVECNALVMSSSAGSRVIFGVLNASGGAQLGPQAAWTAAAAFVRSTAKILVTGLTVGASYTIQAAWQTQVGTTTGTISYGSASPFNGPVNLVVTAA